MGYLLLQAVDQLFHMEASKITGFSKKYISDMNRLFK